MKLVIELTNSMIDACGDCECVAEMIAGISKEDLKIEFERQMPEYYFEE